MKNRNVALTLIGLIVTLGFPALPVSRWENEFAGTPHLIGYEIIWWLVVAAVLGYVCLGERRPLSSIGFRRIGIWDVVIAVLAAVVIVAGLGVIYYVVFPALHWSEAQAVNQLIATPFWWRFISVIRAAVGEEILFRGYAIERLDELTGRRSVAAVISCLIFTLEHVGSWGWSHVLLAGFGGIMLTVLYLWRRKLWVNIIAHFIVDGAAVLF
ncbi:MAG TPA: type II CAAX endopeptidase family protein [Puia sp.]|jgi:membrane protease YdiL (CAAX protease family)|nr:type II CAAX endopeptidase family protein [Puia sp.]